MNEAEYEYKIKALDEWLTEETIKPTLDTADYMKVWNKKHTMERKYADDYAAEKLAEKVAHSDMCLEAFK
jgi:hypothetical protein